MPTLTLIDGSGFIFRAYHAIPHLSTTKGLPTNAVYGFTNMLLKALREREPTHVALIFDAGRKSFRVDLDPTYKANRPTAPDDLSVQFPLVRRVAAALNIPVLEDPSVEADDIIGTLATQARARDWNVVIVTGDKDFAQLVDDKVELYDPMAETGGRGKVAPRSGKMTAVEVEEKFGVKPSQIVEYMSILGDKIDNVPGIAGVGEVTAASLIKHFGTVEAMLSRPEEIASAVARGGERVREKIMANVDRLRLNRQLVMLKCDLPLAQTPDDFIRRSIDNDTARAIFTEFEFTRLVKELPPPPPTPGLASTSVVSTPAELAVAVAALKSESTAGIGVQVVVEGSARSGFPVGLALAVPGRAFYFPLEHRYLGAPPMLSAGIVREALEPLLSQPEAAAEETGEKPAIEKHVHGAKAAWHVLRSLGFSPQVLSPLGVDTDLASRLLQPIRREHDLVDVARERLSIELAPWPTEKEGPMSGQTVERLAILAGSSAEAVARLGANLRQAMQDEGLTRLYNEVEQPVISILANMEAHGVPVNRGALETLSVEFGKSMGALEEKIFELAGGRFNLGSTRELGAVLFERLQLPVQKRLKTGPSTDQEVLEKLSELHALPALVLEHRGLSKLKSTYVDALPSLIDPKDNRLHTTFNQAGAATGRLSSTDPNLQNIPIRTELSKRIRGAFCAPDDKLLLSADYSQIELRILAHYAADESLIESFRLREDVHQRTAAETFGVAPDQVTDDQRRIAKVLNFGIAYGLSAFGLSQRLDLPTSEAQGIIDRYFARYAGVKRWLEGTIEQARRDGFVTTLYGRKRPLPDILSRNPAARQGAERMAVNTPIQGTAADIMKIAMIRTDASLRMSKLPATLLLQVHDELVVESEPAAVEQVTELVRREMSTAAELRVPLDVDVGVGATWADAH